MRLTAIALLLLAAAGCAEQLRENQRGWRKAECDSILDTRTRERCLKEAR